MSKLVFVRDILQIMKKK
uniref:Uncharacterized protein n=1 Tax=Anguilla anguilla TaxID=7936 RepID=A0A0E9QTR3_ANGAN